MAVDKSGAFQDGERQGRVGYVPTRQMFRTDALRAHPAGVHRMRSQDIKQERFEEKSPRSLQAR